MLSLQKQIVWMSRVQWTLGAALIISVGVFYAVGYRPRTIELSELKDRIAKQQHDLNSTQSQTKILPTVSADVQALRARLANFKTMPRQNELPQFIKDIAQLGQQASLRKFDLKPGAPTRTDRFNELPIQLTFEGDFLEVCAFLRHAEDLPRMTRVNSMSIKTKDKQSGQVRVQLTMNIYFAGD